MASSEALVHSLEGMDILDQLPHPFLAIFVKSSALVQIQH
jgi:hypothetical protein